MADSTETYGNATVTDAHEPEALRLHSQGKPLPGMQLRIVDPETRAVLPPGDVGEILVAGYVTPGYYRDPENNARAFDAEGAFRTGDLGRRPAASSLPDAMKGEVPVAAVQLREGETATAEEIRGFCRDHIASYKIPVHVVVLRPDEFPRTSTGKVQKTGLREVIAARLQSSSVPLTHREGSVSF